MITVIYSTATQVYLGLICHYEPLSLWQLSVLILQDAHLQLCHFNEQQYMEKGQGKFSQRQQSIGVLIDT